MPYEQTQHTDTSRSVWPELSHTAQGRMGPQYAATSLDGHSSAHFGDVYHQYHSNYVAQGQSRIPPHSSSLIPFRRDRDFIERDILYDIYRRTSEPAARIGLVGLGGVGKTQIAIEYAYRRREADPQLWVFWVHASSGARFEESYRQIAQQVQISNWADPKADTLSMVYTWLSDEHNGRWTMVVDNADSGEVLFGSRSGGAATSTMASASPAIAASSDRLLSDYLPSSAHGSIVITSRSRAVAVGLIEDAEDVLDVGPMTREDATALLIKKLKKPQRDAGREQLVRLVQELDYIPLAITQAAAYITQLGSRMTVAQYLERLVRSDLDRERLLQKDVRDPRRDGCASNSIIVTWHTSFEHIRQTRGSAARLLGLMSLFDREGIPESLLQGLYFSEEEEQLREIRDTDDVHDQYDFKENIAILKAYGLVNNGTDEQLFDMHRLVQFSTRKWLELHGELVYWQGRYIGILDAAFPTGDYVNWSTCQTLFSHVEAMMSCRMASADHLRKRAAILYRGAWYAWQSGRYRIAGQMAWVSLDDRERLLGTGDIQILDSMDMLALVLRYQGKYEQAEQMNRRALTGREKELGKNHPNTLTSVSNLASVLQDQGKYEQAEQMNRRALTGREKELGENHPDTLTSVDNLASVLQYQGKYEQAEQMNRRALTGREKELGENHPDTLTSVSNLASILQYQGKYEQAEQMNRRALSGSEKELGKYHPDTLTSVYCLADLLRVQQDYQESLRLYDRAVQGYVDVLGPSHPTTLACQRHRRSLLQDINLPSTT